MCNQWWRSLRRSRLAFKSTEKCQVNHRKQQMIISFNVLSSSFRSLVLLFSFFLLQIYSNKYRWYQFLFLSQQFHRLVQWRWFDMLSFYLFMFLFKSLEDQFSPKHFKCSLFLSLFLTVFFLFILCLCCLFTGIFVLGERKQKKTMLYDWLNKKKNKYFHQ